MKRKNKNWKTTFGKSPFTTAFIKGTKKGIPCWTIVNTIATKTRKNPTVIWNSLFKAGLVWRQKINNQWIFWAKTGKKTTGKNINTCTTGLWQCFADWCIASGTCTPMQLAFKTGATKNFTNNCRTYFTKFFTTNGITGTWTTTTGFNTMKSWNKNKKRTTTSKKKTTIHSRKRKSTRKNTWSYSASKSYKFPMYKSYGSTKRYRRAA
jgi:hypothetical protein